MLVGMSLSILQPLVNRSALPACVQESKAAAAPAILALHRDSSSIGSVEQLDCNQARLPLPPIMEPFKAIGTVISKWVDE